MPAYTLTSPKTGKTYNLDINGTPGPDDWDEIGQQLDAQEAQRAGVDPAVLEQGPVGTFVNTVRNIGPEFLAGPVAGLAKLNETLGRSPLAALSPLGLANQATAMMTGINPLGGVERAAEVIQQEGQDMRPTNPFNPTAQTVGQAVNQIGGMIATGGTAALAGMPARTAAMVVPQVYGLAAGAGQGIDTARDMGITDPTAQAGMGLAFGGVEALTEKIGGIGGDAVNKFINPTSLLGRSALNTISESGEEILAGRAQDAITVGAGQFVSDPNRPGFTRSGFQLPSLNPLNPDTLARMKQEAIGGAAGGVIFSGLQALSPAMRDGVGQTMSDPGAPDVPESTGELTAADVADLEQPVPSSQFSVPGSQISPEIPASTDPTQTITGSNGEMAPEMPVPPPTADAGAGAGVTVSRRQVPAFRDFGLDQPQPASGDVITDLRIPRSPEAIAETQRLEQERMIQEAKLRSQQAKAGRGPVIPDSPLGVYDILDFVNENRIRLPRKGEERGGEYDWAETYSIPTYYRQFLGNTERGANIDQVAQMAFENGFIREPTADALMSAIQQGIDTRKQYKVQFAQRAKEQAQVEKQVLDFEKTQGKLRSKDKDRIAFENIAPGDEMTIDGEKAVVRNIEYTEDGELTNVVIEDGKRFGLMQHDPQRREGIFVDEFTPKPRPQPEGEAVFSPATPGRSRPKTTITFATPIVTPIGKIRAYSWASKLEEVTDVKTGEVVERRFSDWDKAVTNAETGRNIVHQFDVEKKDGTVQAVSLETALGKLTPTDKKTVQDVVRAARRLPLRQAELVELETAQANYEAQFDQARESGWRQAPEPELRTPEFPPLAERGVKTVYVGRYFAKNLEPAELSQAQDPRQIVEWKRQWAMDQVPRLPVSTGDRIATLRRGIKKDLATLKSAGVSNQPAPLMSPASRNFTGGLAGSLQQAGRQVSSSRFQVASSQTQPVPGSKSQVSSSGQPETLNLKPETLNSAYAVASQGQSTSFVPIQAVWEQARAQNPALTPTNFMDDLMRQYEQGTVLLEGANSRQEADAAGLRIDGTPVGTAVRMAMVPPDGGMANDEGRSTKALQNPASVTPAQDAAYLAAVQAGDLATAQRMVDEAARKAGYNSPKVYHGTGAEFTVFERLLGGKLTDAKSARLAIFFTTDEKTAKSYAVYASEAGPVRDLLAKAEKAEKRGNWAEYERLTEEAEKLDTYEARLLRRQTQARVVSAYLKGDFTTFDAEGKTPQELADDMDSPITNAIVQARRAGKNGVLFKNLDDAIDLSNRPADHYAVFTASQIKSADPVTYDDAGNVIPLSQRFQESSPDIRYSPAELAATEKANIAALKALGLPTRNGWRNYGGNLVAKAMEKIAADPTKAATTRMMASLLAKADLRNLLLHIESDARLRYAGIYQPMDGGRGEIGLNLRALGRGSETGVAGDIATSLVHEALHHATYRALRSPKNAIQKSAIADLEALRKRAKAALAANEALSQFDYELSNTDEFIAGLFTRADFQQALAAIPAELAPKTLTQRVRSMLDEIFRTLAELVVGRKVAPGSVLDAAFAASLRLMEDGGPSVQAASTPADSAGIGQDSAAGLFRYAPRDESTLDAGERAALNAVRDAYPGERVEPLRLQDLQPSPDGPRRGQMRRDSLREWSGIFGRLFGKRILFIDGPARLNGASASGQRNVIVVNANSREPLLYVLGHELTHALKAQRPQLYQELEREILRSGENLEKYRDKLRKLKYAEKELNNELVADFIGSQMLEPKFLNQLAATKPPLFERFAQAVVKFLDSLLSKVSKLNRDVRPYFEQKIQPLREQLAAVLKDYAATGVFPDNPLDDSGDVNLSRKGLMNPATDPNLTRSRFAPPREADQVINTREDAQVALEAGRWLASVDRQTAIEQFFANAVPLPLDAQQHAAGLLIAQLSAQYDQSRSEVERMWNHVQMQRMARVWKSEFLSADPARSQRQRAVVNNTILQPISAVLAAQEVLIDRGTRVTKARFEGGGEGVVTKIIIIIRLVDQLTGQALKDKLSTLPNISKLLNDLRKKMLPGMTWEEIFTDLPSTQKARQRAIYERLKKDQRLQALTPEERLKLTNELDKAWQRERRKVFRRELDKAGVLGEKAPSDRQKVKNAMPKLLRLINLGMFNSEMFREAIAPEYGLRVIDAATAAKLRHLAEAAYSMPEGILRNRKLGELLHAMQAATGSSIAEIVNSYWTASVLSGLRTQFDTWLAFINGAGTNLIQAGALLARGQGRNAIGAHAAWWRGLRDGVRESLQILARGDYSVLKKFGSDLNETLKGEKNWRPVPLGESLWQNGNVWQKYAMAPVMIWTGRLMAAADHINNTATTAGAMAVARAMHPELYNGRGDFTAQERADAQAQALREITGGNPPADKQQRVLVDVRTREILYATVSEDLRQAASDIGDVAAYQNDPTGMFGTLYRVVKGALGTAQRALDEKAQDMEAAKMARALAAVLSGSLYGVTGTRFIRFGFNFGADLTRYIPGTALFKDLYGGAKMSRMEQDLLIGKNIVGLMITSTLAALFLTGDDEDEGWQIEGDWSNLTPQEQKARMAAGIERMTLWRREDGKVRRVSYKQWPTMALFAAVGGMLDEKRHRPDQWVQRGVPGHLLRGALTGIYQVKNVTAMRGLMELFGESSFGTDKTGAWGDALIRAGSNFVGGAVPTLVKDAEVWNDPRSFKPEGVLESVMRGMPIARKFVNDGRPQLNLLGEEIKLQRAPWSRAYTSVASAEAHRVLGALMARGLALPQPSDQIAVYQNGVKMPLEKLGREAVWRYERAVGEGYRAWLAEDGNRLLAMPVAAADKVIAARAGAIKQQALARVTGR